MKIEEMIFECRCQKCPAPMTITPLTKLESVIVGTISIPGHLICANCGAIMTTLVRKFRDEEKPKKE